MYEWMEIIQVRAMGIMHKVIIEELVRFYSNGETVNGLEKVKIYKNASYNTDVCICLHWKTEQVMQSGSRLGIEFIQILKEHGMVAHNVWECALPVK